MDLLFFFFLHLYERHSFFLFFSFNLTSTLYTIILFFSPVSFFLVFSYVNHSLGLVFPPPTSTSVNLFGLVRERLSFSVFRFTQVLQVSFGISFLFFLSLLISLLCFTL